MHIYLSMEWQAAKGKGCSFTGGNLQPLFYKYTRSTEDIPLNISATDIIFELFLSILRVLGLRHCIQ